ncbi:putative ribonuclease H-like domain-containing protein [Tanacetum coccineum]
MLDDYVTAKIVVDSIADLIDLFEPSEEDVDLESSTDYTVDRAERNAFKNVEYRATQLKIPPPYIGNFMPPTPDLSLIGLDEFVNNPVVKNIKSNEEVSKVVRKSDDSLIIEDWVLDSEEENVSQTKTKKKTIKPSIAKIEVYHQNFAKETHPCAKKNFVPRAVLMKSGLVSVNTARQVNAAHSKTTVNAARPKSYLSQTAHSTVKRPIHKNTALKNSNIDQRVNTVSGKKINIARPKAVVNVVKGNSFNAVKASVRWGNSQMDLQDQGVIDSGCSRHMTGNMSYLTDYEEIDGGYAAFRGNPKGGKITRKATKDETSGILKSFITGIENLVDHKIKMIRCDNGTEIKNKEMNQFCEMKGILRQFSVAKTPQQNGVTKRRNRILIEADRTMLADSKLPTTF